MTSNDLTSSEYEFVKYVATKDNLNEVINKYGVAIIPSILDEKECEALVDGVWDFFEKISGEWKLPIDRKNKDTWREFYKLYPLHSMLIQHWGVGHAQVSWELRQKEKIVEIFAAFWKCSPEELLVSFDGLSLALPPEITKKGWNRQNTWFHTDQSYTDNSFKCIQSWITGLDVEEGDATLAFIEGSNRFHEECGKQFKILDKKNWYKLDKEEEKFYIDKGCSYKKIACPKGSMVFWDSRTIHCGAEPMKGRVNPKLRSIIYLCYMPRALCSKTDLKKKQKAFEDNRTTSHWPCKATLFSKSPRTYGGEMPLVKQVEKPVLTELGKKLAGF